MKKIHRLSLPKLMSRQKKLKVNALLPRLKSSRNKEIILSKLMREGKAQSTRKEQKKT